ncbi:MAG: hypothetical protein ACOCZ2_00270 [Thermodesulfobacteriota bacterium]
MSLISREIMASMTDFQEESPERASAWFVFSSDFTGFNGHFPGRKILPGICMLQAVLETMKKWQNREVKLQEIVQAKFFSPVGNDEQVVLTCNKQEKEGRQNLVKAVLNTPDRKIAQLRIKTEYTD